MKKIVKPLSLLIVLVVAVVGFYLYKLHALALEGNKIFEYRCTNVNPPLISYKNAFLKYASFLNSYPNTKYTPDDVKDFLDSYISGLRSYISEEEKWLEIQKQYINRWDFKLVEPWYIKETADYQWKMYDGYKDDAKSILVKYDNPELVRNIPSLDDVSEERQRRDKYSDLYFESFDKAQQISDWRKFFARVPIPEGCTEENLTIPDTSGAIDWEGKAPPSPAAVPIEDTKGTI